jgi:hypothetical protein
MDSISSSMVPIRNTSYSSNILAVTTAMDHHLTRSAVHQSMLLLQHFRILILIPIPISIINDHQCPIIPVLTTMLATAALAVGR